jgi:putative oxidoreductase
MKLARAILRITIGLLFVGHGTQKLFGWFGGKGLDATAESFESMGLYPGRENAVAAGATEALGGALLALGALTPLALGALVGVMITAVRTVHWKNGVWVTEGGYEYNLVLIAALLALAEGGPGPLSLDGALGHGSGSLLEAAGMLSLGAAGSYATVEAAKRRAPAAAGAAA